MRDPARVQRSTLEIAATWLACGLDPDTEWFYRQSDIPEIPELPWLLACVAPKGALNRAHAYKAAVERNRGSGDDDDAGISAGLFMYSVLMAADILLFDADWVPVGRDQVQHIEMARDFGQRFNHVYGDHFAPLRERTPPSRRRSKQNQKPAVRITFERNDVAGVSPQHRLDILGGAVAASDPDDRWRRHRELTAFLKIRVLRHDREAMICRVAPDRFIVSAFQTELSNVLRPGEQVREQIDQARRQVLVEQQLHAASVNCVRSRSAA